MPEEDPRIRSLGVLMATRRSYFDKSLNPALLGTGLAFISEHNRLPAVRAVLPLVLEKHRGVLRRLIEVQEGAPWIVEPGRSPWRTLRDLPYGPAMADVEDLTSLYYPSLFEGITAPAYVDRNGVFTAVQDYLVNDIAVLESLRLVAESQRALHTEGPDVGRTRVLSFNELRMHLHTTTAIVRLRAGWDNMLNNVLCTWFAPPDSRKWPDKWPARIRHMEARMQTQNSQIRSFWEDWKRNADEIAEARGLRSIRDDELHFYGVRIRETFGFPGRDYGLDDLLSLAIKEQRRMVDAWLLTVAMMRAASPPGPAPA